jgi:membrane protease subunit HflK
MPWNEPGGNDKDPWGKKSGSSSKGSGNADIEDITRKMNEKLGGLFGNKKTGDDSSGGPNLASLGMIALFAFLGWLATGFYQVNSAQRGVEFRFGAYLQTTKAGLHWHLPYPIDSVELVDVDKSRTADDQTQMLTKDENIVDVGISAQYRIKDPEDYLFNVYLADYEKNQTIGTLFQVMRSAVREIVGRNTMDSILIENRQSIAPETQQVMQKVLDKYKSGLEVIKVNLIHAKPPQQVKDAFDDAIRAREDRDKFKNEAETYAKKVVPKAKGKASRLNEDALAYKSKIVSQAEGDASRFTQLVAEYNKAPEVTRKRLYLETMEEVYANTKKVMVDTKSGNNMLYLPLNELQSGSTSAGKTSGFDPAIAAGAMQQQRLQRKTIRDGVRNGTREGRR